MGKQYMRKQTPLYILFHGNFILENVCKQLIPKPYINTVVYKYTHTHIYIYIYIFTHMYVCVCVCIYAYIYIYIYI